MARPTVLTPANAERAALLRTQGQGVKKIALELGVGVRSVFKLLAMAREAAPAKAFEPWTLLTALEDGDTPGKAKWLAQSGLAWTRADARWAWLIHEIRPELPALFVLTFSAQYRWLAADPHCSWQSKVMHIALVKSPWENLREAVEFYRIVAAEASTSERLDFVSSIDLALRRTWRGVTGEHEPTESSGSPGLDQVPKTLREKVLGLLDKRQADDARPAKRSSQLEVLPAIRRIPNKGQSKKKGGKQ